MTAYAALAAASLLLLAAMIVPRLISGWSLLARAIWRLAVLIVLTLLVQHLLGSPIAPRFDTGATARRLWEQVIEIGWWIVAAQSAIGLMRLAIVFEARPRETRIISDLVAGIKTRSGRRWRSGRNL